MIWGNNGRTKSPKENLIRNIPSGLGLNINFKM
jgi:hypothetical protein